MVQLRGLLNRPGGAATSALSRGGTSQERQCATHRYALQGKHGPAIHGTSLSNWATLSTPVSVEGNTVARKY
jgi:hypothetical protein